MVRSLQTVILLGDMVALSGAYALMALIRFDVGLQGSRIWMQLGFFALLFVVWIIVFFIFDLYSVRRVNPNPRNIGLLITAMILNTLFAALGFYFTPALGISPKTNLAILSIAAIALLIAWRRLFYTLYSSTFVRRIGIIGDNALIEDLKTDLAKNPHLGTVVFHHADSTTPIDTPVDLLIVDAVAPATLLELSRNHNTETLTLSDAYETLFGKVPLRLMTDTAALTLITRADNTVLFGIARVSESIVALCILIITSPLLLLAVIARLIEDGAPIFYTQTRVGKHGRHFTLYKLRSMVKDAEKDGAQWASKNDTRITTLGRILRVTHIDEIPQMFNIIRGDIALIGPRPERPEFVADLETRIPFYYLRHSVRPGFTGWAQIKFRYAASVLDTQEKFEYDLYYIKNKNLPLNIGILLKTVQIIFTH